jgi:hypothetical protein
MCMTEQQAPDLRAQLAKLREPFAPANVAHLPKVWCKDCREAPSKVCSKHRKRTCQHCNNNITEAHADLDYVGHAEVTSRLLSVDPQWTWEPLALDEKGLPLFDEYKGLWMKLTICGVSRIGYGTAEWPRYKDPGNIIKEIIGDAIRNAAQRFGVALDLWAKTDLSADRAQFVAETLNETFNAPMEQPADKPAVRYLDADGRERVDLLSQRIGLKSKAETMYVASILIGRAVGSLAEVKAEEGADLLAELDEIGDADRSLDELARRLAERSQPVPNEVLVKGLRNQVQTASSPAVLRAVVEQVRDELERFHLPWSDYNLLMAMAQKRLAELKVAP